VSIPVDEKAGRRDLWGVSEDTELILVWRKETEGRPHCSLSFLRRGCGEGCADLFFLVSHDRTCGNGSELPQGRFRLNIRKHLFTKRVVKHWNRLPRGGDCPVPVSV